MCTHLYTVEQVELAVADGLGGGEEDAQDAAQLLHVVQLEHLINRFLFIRLTIFSSKSPEYLDLLFLTCKIVNSIATFTD